MRSLKILLLFGIFLTCALSADAQVTKVDATRLVKPAGTASRLFVTNGSTLPAWVDAASFFTEGTGIDITGNTISATTGLPSGSAHQTLRYNGSAWVATSNLANDASVVTISNTDANTSYASSATWENLILRNTNSTNNNWSAISSYSTAGALDASIGFRHTNHTSANGYISLFTRTAGSYTEVVKFDQSSTDFAFPVAFGNNISLAGSRTATFDGTAVFNAGFTVNSITPTFNTPLALGSTSVGSYLKVFNDYSNTSAAQTTGYDALRLINRNGTTGNWTAMQFDVTDGFIGADLSAQFVDRTNGYTDVVFHSRGPGGYIETGRFTNTGRLGLGTAAPSQVLDVNGTARFRGAIYDITNSSGSTNQTLVNSSGGFAWSSQIINDGSAVGIGGNPVSGWELYTAGAGRFDGTLAARGTGNSSVLTSPTLRLWNTTATTGQIWALNSANNGNLLLDSDNAGTVLQFDGATGDATLSTKLLLPSLGSTSTGLLGINASGQVSNVGLSGLSMVSGTLTVTASGASTAEPFLMAAASAGTSAERVATAGTNVAIADGGANSTMTFSALTTTASLPGDITPTAFGTTQNDYNPTGLSGAVIIRQDITASADLTGLAGGSDGRIIHLQNIDDTYTIRLKQQNASSTAANRFELGGSDLSISPNGTATFIYDATSSRWRLQSLTTPATQSITYEYTTAQTNTALTIPKGARAVAITCVGAGAGGGSGRKGATGTVRCGGGGGTSGGIVRLMHTLYGSDATTFYINVGTGGAGGTSISANSTNGNAGSDGGESDVRVDGTATTDRLIRVSGGQQGFGGTSSNGAGGASITFTDFSVPAAGNATTNGAGGNVGGSSNTPAPGSGGAGAGISSGNAASTGGAGGAGYYQLSAGGAASTAATAISLNREAGGGGGGGSSSTSGAASAGGAGVRGGGGGGGGASVDSVGNSGAGGAGGAGYVKLIFFF